MQRESFFFMAANSVITYSLGSSPINWGKRGWREWGKKQGPTWGRSQSSILLFGHLSLLTGNTLACVFREPSPLCGEREEENISGSLHYIPVWASPVSPLFCHWLCFPSYPDVCLCPLEESSPTRQGCVFYGFDSEFLILWSCSRRHILTVVFSTRLVAAPAEFEGLAPVKVSWVISVHSCKLAIQS